jgi:hypothetical protein
VKNNVWRCLLHIYCGHAPALPYVEVCSNSTDNTPSRKVPLLYTRQSETHILMEAI